MKSGTNEPQGIKFSKNGYHFNGSKVDKQFSYSKIDFALRQNNREEQRQESITQQPKPQQPQQRCTPMDSGDLISGGGGLFGSLFTTNPVYNPEEDEFRRRMQRKKKRNELSDFNV